MEMELSSEDKHKSPFVAIVKTFVSFCGKKYF